MVEMRVGEEDVGVDRARAVELRAEPPQPRAAIEDHHALAESHLEARRVAAIAQRVRAWTGDRAADTPERDGERGHARGPQRTSR
jgi:hypothetical protein